MFNNNYKTNFISIIIAYYIAQMLLAFIWQNTENIRYFSVFQLAFFVAPILFFIKENIFSELTHTETNSSIIQHQSSNFWNTVKNELKINLNFKPEIIVYLLWGLFGLSLLNAGVMSITEYFIPNKLMEIYDSVMKNTIATQIYLTTNHSKTIFEFLQIVFFIALIPAVCEEILFRGYLMQNIMADNSPLFALITSALIFSIIHFNIGGFLPIFFIGLYLGMLVYATKSIIPAIFLHFLNNFFIIIGMNYGDINYEQNIPIGFGLLLFILGGILVSFTYSKIKICKIK